MGIVQTGSVNPAEEQGTNIAPETPRTSRGENQEKSVVQEEKQGEQTKEADTNIDGEDDIASLLEGVTLQDFDIPIVFNEAVKYYIQYFTTEKKKVFTNWLRRSKTYVPIIKEILKEQGMPEDLVYLAMIESGFNPKAYSPAKACGPWQFIYETGGRYGLSVNYWIDERKDPEKSTVAAAKYLRDLFNQFGCWYLAAAGYNAGEKRVERAIEKHNTNDFWELSKYNALPRETREYIPKLIAAAIIAKDPAKFGFGIISYEPPIAFSEVKVPRATPLRAIAKSASMDLSELRAFNPEILRGITPPGIDDYAVKLPPTVKIGEFQRCLDTALADERRVKGVTTYKVRKGDTLAKIMKRYKVSKDDVYLVNDCENNLKVKPGMVLSIPQFNGSSERRTTLAAKSPGNEGFRKEKKFVKTDQAEDKTQQTHKSDKTQKQEQLKAYHVVKKGESLANISDKYGLDIASLKAFNNLKNDRVYPKMKLCLVSHTEKKDRVQVKYHTVRRGETLSVISKKYGVDVADLKSVNNLKNDKVYPKMRLRIANAEG